MSTQIGALRSLRTANFALLWSAQVVSGFGDKVTIFALAFVTWQITHSALSTVLSIVMATVPYAVFGFLGGAVADALGHRRAMIACDLIRVAVIGAIPTTLALAAPLAVPYLLVVVSALCSTVFNPARMGLVPDLVPREQLAASNSMVYASDRTVEIIGAAAAGAVVAVLGASAFYVDAATFALSAFLLVRITTAVRGSRPIRLLNVVRDALDGLRFLSTNSVLRANTVFSLLAQLSIPVLNGLTPVLVFRDYGLGPEQFGVVEAAQAAGAVGAGLTLPSLLSRQPKGKLVIIGFAAYGAVLLLIGAASSFAVVTGLFVAAGIANVLFYVPNVTISQELAPTELRARVFGARMALLNVTWLPVVLAVGAIAEFTSANVLIAAAGAFTLAVAIIGSFIRSLREVE
jgi:MFS family permease